ncbi:MAG: hypothetical protein ACFFCS_15065 [Candidatus Hodarchaeota archaeon]
MNDEEQRDKETRDFEEAIKKEKKKKGTSFLLIGSAMGLLGLVFLFITLFITIFKIIFTNLGTILFIIMFIIMIAGLCLVEKGRNLLGMKPVPDIY